MNELTTHIFSTAKVVDGVQILDDSTTIDELISIILDDKTMWYYDGTVYHMIIAFEDGIGSLTIYYTNADGSVSSKVYGGDD
jgi:hypothetical protein